MTLREFINLSLHFHSWPIYRTINKNIVNSEYCTSRHLYRLHYFPSYNKDDHSTAAAATTRNNSLSQAASHPATECFTLGIKLNYKRSIKITLEDVTANTYNSHQQPTPFKYKQRIHIQHFFFCSVRTFLLNSIVNFRSLGTFFYFRDASPPKCDRAQVLPDVTPTTIRTHRIAV